MAGGKKEREEHKAEGRGTRRNVAAFLKDRKREKDCREENKDNGWRKERKSTKREEAGQGEGCGKESQGRQGERM
jgi:hypothetical protein